MPRHSRVKSFTNKEVNLVLGKLLLKWQFTQISFNHLCKTMYWHAGKINVSSQVKHISDTTDHIRTHMISRDDVMTWKGFVHSVPLMFSLLLALINCWANSRDVGNMRRRNVHETVVKTGINLDKSGLPEFKACSTGIDFFYIHVT